MKKLSRLIFVALLAQSCLWWDPEPFRPEFPVGVVEGYRPIYLPNQEASVIAFGAPRAVKHPGKIYLFEKYLLINERYAGIHVYDNDDPAHPMSLGFLAIAGNIDVAIRGNVLYADHLGNLVALDITDWNNPRELSRTQLPDWTAELPPSDQRYFECVEAGRGTVVGWELVTLNDPRCYR